MTTKRRPRKQKIRLHKNFHVNIRKFVEKHVELRPGQSFDEAVIQFSQVALWVKDNNTQMLAFCCR